MIPYLSRAEMAVKAAAILNKYVQLTGNPITYPVRIDFIVESMDIEIIPFEDLKKTYGVDAYTNIHLNKVIVDLDQYDDPTKSKRYRFTLAHELAHIEVHGVFLKSVPQRAQVGDYNYHVNRLKPDEYDRFEIQANGIGSFLLMPPAELTSQIARLKAEAPKRGLSGEAAKGFIIGSLSNYFDASAKAVETRLINEGVTLP